MKNWKKDILNIPNMLSLFRLVLIPLYVYIYLTATEPRQFFLAGTILAVSCLTDMVDGKIARHFNMITTLGKALDPLADKLTQLALTLCLSFRYPVIRIVLLVFLVKELFQLFAAIKFYRQGKAMDGALFMGKICTTVLFLSFIFLVIVPDLNYSVVIAIAMVDLFFLAVTFVQYFLAFFGKNPKVQDIEK